MLEVQTTMAQQMGHRRDQTTNNREDRVESRRFVGLVGVRGIVALVLGLGGLVQLPLLLETREWVCDVRF